MKPASALSFAAATILVSALPALAQDYYRVAEPPPAYDNGYGYRRVAPPLGVPPLAAYEEPRASVVTTTRRVEYLPEGGDVRTVVTTRRIVRNNAESYGIVDRPPRPVPFVAPGIRNVVTRDLREGPYYGGIIAAAPPRPGLGAPIVIEERRVETTRRYLGQDDAELDD